MTDHGSTIRAHRPVPRGPGALALTVLTGLDPDATAMLASGLLTRTERCAVVWVDPTTAEAGHLDWRVDDSDGRYATGRLDIVDGCLPCALRAVVLHRLLELRDAGRCDAVVLRLHPAIETEAIVASLCAGLPPDLARVDTIACVLDAGTWLTDLAGDDDLHSRGLAIGPHDDRSVSLLLGSQLDVADRIVLLTPGTGLRPLAAEQWTALRALAPDARRFVPPTVLDVPAGQLLRTGAHDPRCLHPLAERGLLDWRRATTPHGSLQVVRWSRRDRPLHPVRLHDALDELADGVIRSAGHLWFAHAADTVVRWDSCGEHLHLGAVAGFENAGVITGNRLAFLGDGLDRAAITATLEACVLTDDELDRPPSAWATLPHPLPDWDDLDPDDRADPA